MSENKQPDHLDVKYTCGWCGTQFPFTLPLRKYSKSPVAVIAKATQVQCPKCGNNCKRESFV